MKHILFLFAILTAFTTHLPARTIIFDIHGVLLHENISNYVKEKVKQALLNAQKETRGLKDSAPYQKLCQLMLTHKPLENLPPIDFPQDSSIPYETYAMFAGHVSPNELYRRLQTMLSISHFDSDMEQLLVTTMVDAIFNREEFLQTIVPLQEGITLFSYLIEHTDHTVCIFSNAPQEWIDLYHTAFANVFEKLPRSHVLTSGALGLLKPAPDAFATVAKRLTEPLNHCVLIDDTEKNVRGAQACGMQAVHFDYTRIEEAIKALRSINVLKEHDIIALHRALTQARTTTLFGEHVLF